MTKLLGYVKKSKDKVRISISREAFNDTKGYKTATGSEYVSMVIDLNKLRLLLVGMEEVTTVVEEPRSHPVFNNKTEEELWFFLVRTQKENDKGADWNDIAEWATARTIQAEDVDRIVNTWIEQGYCYIPFMGRIKVM